MLRNLKITTFFDNFFLFQEPDIHYKRLETGSKNALKKPEIKFCFTSCPDRGEDIAEGIAQGLPVVNASGN